MDIDIATSFAVLLPVLAGLALVDSLSFGTLAIPVWLLMAPGKVRFARVGLYLVTIGLFYFVVGCVLLSAARFASFQLSINWQHPMVIVLGFVFGAGMLVLSFVLDPSDTSKHPQRAQTKKISGIYRRLTAWRESAVEVPDARPARTVDTQQDTRRSTMGLVSIALTAGGLELATMLPYLAAIGLLTASAPALELSTIQSAGLLAAYCLVMVLPALVLLLARAMLKNGAGPLLQRIDGWFAKNGQSTVAWVLGIVGVVLMLNTWEGVADLVAS